MKWEKLLRYWLCGFIIVAILSFSLGLIYFATILIVGQFAETTTNPNTGEVTITGFNTWSLIFASVITFVVTPIIIGAVSHWASNKILE